YHKPSGRKSVTPGTEGEAGALGGVAWSGTGTQHPRDTAVPFLGMRSETGAAMAAAGSAESQAVQRSELALLGGSQNGVEGRFRRTSDGQDLAVESSNSGGQLGDDGSVVGLNGRLQIGLGCVESSLQCGCGSDGSAEDGGVAWVACAVVKSSRAVR